MLSFLTAFFCFFCFGLVPIRICSFTVVYMRACWIGFGLGFGFGAHKVGVVRGLDFVFVWIWFWGKKGRACVID